MKRIIVAIDGYSSCGKSTMAKAIAAHAGYTYVDTGAMYRAVAFYALQHDLNEQQLIAALQDIHVSFIHTPDGQHVCLNGEDVERLIRTLEVGNKASQISQIREVRQFLVAQQQEMGNEKGIVMDGRDIGTVVFPNAELKLFLTATPEERANRRFKELWAARYNKEKRQTPLFFLCHQLAKELFHVNSLLDKAVQVLNLHAVLRHRVAVANGYTVVIECVVVNGDAEWRTDSVLTAIPFANRIFLVIRGLEVKLQHIHHLAGLLRQSVLLNERHHASFNRSEYRR